MLHRSSRQASSTFAEVDKYVQRVLSETPAHVEEVIIEKAKQVFEEKPSLNVQLALGCRMARTG